MSCQNLYVEVLTQSTSEYDLTWRLVPHKGRNLEIDMDSGELHAKTKAEIRGAWVTQLVKEATLDFNSGCELQVLRLSREPA